MTEFLFEALEGDIELAKKSIDKILKIDGLKRNGSEYDDYYIWKRPIDGITTLTLIENKNYDPDLGFFHYPDFKESKILILAYLTQNSAPYIHALKDRSDLFKQLIP